MTSSQRVHFEGGSGERLVARLELPEARPAAWALFAHCFTCSKDLRAAVAIGRALAERGIAVLRFDFTGIGESEGRFEQTSFASNVEDVVAAAAWLRESHEAPRLLVGHSLGGAAVVVAAPRVPEVRAVATLAAPFDPGQTRARLERRSPEFAARGEAEIELGGRRFVVRRSFWDQTGPEQMSEALASFRGALLVLHSPADGVVSLDDARRLFESARHPKSFVSLDDADHLLLKESDAGYAASVLASWASRYIA